MGLFDKVKNAVSNVDYSKKYPQYVGVDFTYDANEYPDGTDLINDFKDDLRFHVEHKEKVVSRYLAKTFIAGTLGKDIEELLDNILGVDELGRWLNACDPDSLAWVMDEYTSIHRALLLSKGFKNWASKGVSAEEFYALYNLVVRIMDYEKDIPYVNWENAAIWNPKSYRNIRLGKKLDSANSFLGNSSTNTKNQAIEYFEKAIKDDMKQFNRNNNH